MSKSRPILIISYYFPPNPSVGSRRWAKYGKVLARNGFDVHVISAECPPGSSSPWDNDILELKVHRIPSKFPSILDDWGKKSILQKIKYRLAEARLRRTTSGTIYDRALFWKEPLQKKVKELIEQHSFTQIIVSTPPHRSAYYISELKSEYPAVDFIVDFRDPWTWGKFREYPSLSGLNRETEVQMADYTLQQADTILVPVEKMIEELKDSHPEVLSKLYLLPSAFDLDDFDSNHIPTSSEKIRFIYFGSLYDNLDEHFSGLAQGLKNFKGRFSFDIYSNTTTYHHYFDAAGLTQEVNYHQPIRTSELMKKAQDADFIFLFKKREWGKDNVSTKFFEICNSRTPFFLIAEDGLASDFVNNNRLGIHCHIEDIEQTCRDLFDQKLKIDYNGQFDTTPYSFQYLGKKFSDDILN